MEARKNVEQMIGEFNKLLQLKLFTNAEITEQISKHEAFEYRLQTSNDIKSDILEYINYAQAFLRLVKQKRRETGIKKGESEVDYHIIYRIKRLYSTVICKDPKDQKIREAYFLFCKDIGDTNASRRALEDWIEAHPWSPEVWHQAADYYTHTEKNKRTALGYITRGLTYIKDSESLFTKLLELELSDAPKQDNEQVTLAKNIQVYIEEMIKNIKKVSYYIHILQLLEEYSFTIKQQEFLIEELKNQYWKDDNVWDALAKRAKRGKYLSTMLSAEDRLSNCKHIYKQGFSRVPAENLHNLWIKYLDCMIEAYRFASLEIRTAELRQTFREAEEAEDERSDGTFYVLERQYLLWIEAAGDQTESLRIAQNAVLKYPQSVDLWMALLHKTMIQNLNTTVTQEDGESQVTRVFNQAKSSLKEKAMPLWEAFIRYHILLSPNDVIRSYYRKVVEEPFEIRKVLMPQYLEWLAGDGSIKETRNVYEALARIEPPCKELHYTMARIESMQVAFDYQQLQRPLRLACDQFGDSDADVYIQLIKFYYTYRKESTVESVGKVYQEAKRRLPEKDLTVFLDKFKNLKNLF